MKRLLVVLQTLLILSAAANASAATIGYQATSLGAGRWEYTYFVSDAFFDVNQGFSVYFDPLLYGNLGLALGNAGWDAIAVQPSPDLQSEGFLDALALVAGASLADPFVVSFDWLAGAARIPGAQPFTINQFDAGGNISFVQGGLTVPAQDSAPVPEPSTLMLLVTGAMGLAPRLRRRPRP
jgi:hypothetical protein